MSEGPSANSTSPRSGTILIAAEKTGRRARSTEIDPHYCDMAIRRWEAFTGKSTMLSAPGETFEDVTERRRGEPTEFGY
jgi:hypothetical protein